MSPQNEPRETKAQRVAKARALAKEKREAEAKRRKRNSWFIRGGVVVIAAILVVAVIVIGLNVAKDANRNSIPDAKSGPVAANVNKYGGVEIGKNGQLIAPTATTNSVDYGSQASPTPVQGATPTNLTDLGIAPSPKDKPINVVIYVDFMCPICNGFEQKNGAVLKKLADAGTITYEYRTIGLLDQFSNGTHYSSRAASAAMCVANAAPQKYQDYFTSLFANQPQENSSGLSNDKLVQLAKDQGVDISSCVSDKTYWPSVTYFTQLGLLHNVQGTPSIFVDGKQYSSQDQSGQFADFESFVQNAASSRKA